jgi:hypothetical protein
MISLPLVIWIAGILIVIGLSLVLYQILSFIRVLASGLVIRVRRILQPNRAFYENLLASLRNDRLQEDALQSSPSALLTLLRAMWRFPLPLLAGAVLALLIHDWMLSPAMLLIAITAMFILYGRARRAQWNRITDDAELLIVQFSSRYAVNHSVSTALEESTPRIASGALRAAAEETVQRMHLGQRLGDAVMPLTRIAHPIPRRLARVLAKSGTGDPAVYADLLVLLREDTQAARALKNSVRTELTVISFTLLVLQLILAGSMILLAFVPLWRNYFTATPANGVKYLLMGILGLIGSLYAERRHSMLEETS